jgi:uncharacterized lipoprotein YddW (UPF0748 family)
MLTFTRSRLVLVTAFCLTLFSILCFQIASPALSQLSQPSPAPASEIRGVWMTNIDSNVLMSREVLTRSLDQLSQLNFNTIYPVVWNWGYTQYPSEVMKAATGIAVDPRDRGLRSRNTLEELVEIGHQKSLKVIPWFEFGFMTNVNSELAVQHPDWITRRRDGTEVWQEGIWQRRWLNPFKPEVQQFIQDLVLEIVMQYDVDGIQFDDHFGLPYEFGYDDYTVQLYRQEHRGQAPPANPRDAEWTKWRADKITAVMTQIFQAIKDKKMSDVIVSLSPNRYDFSYSHSLQDWRTWEQRGLIEELIVQIYTSSQSGFLAEMNRPEVQAARRHIPTAIGILTGLRTRGVPIRQVKEQVNLVRQNGFPGVSFFFFETLWNLTDEKVSDRQSAFQDLFSAPAIRPSLPDRNWTPTR